MMQITNQTVVSAFLLLGFQNDRIFRILLFLFFFLVYVLTLSGNLLIIWLVASNHNLQSPMYFFLTQLSLSDLLLTTDIVPILLYITWNEGGVVSFSGCLVQFHVFCSSEISECFLLAMMAYDRYLAICNPLRYSSVMTILLCMELISLCWLVGVFLALFDIISLVQFQFCGPNVIDHFFCDLAPLLKLSCSDTRFFKLQLLILCFLVLLSPFVIITCSYGCIVRSVLGISTITGRGKAFSTCSSHLAVVSIFYGTLVGSYMIPNNGQSLTVSKVISLLYSVITPMINPIIYSLKNKDITDAIKQKFLNKY